MSKESCGYFTGTSDEGKALIEEVKASGHKINESDVIGIVKNKDGKIIWLEKGQLDGKPSGLAHILDKHENNFNKKGIDSDEIADLILQAVAKSEIVGYQGKGTG